MAVYVFEIEFKQKRRKAILALSLGHKAIYYIMYKQYRRKEMPCSEVPWK